MSRQFVAALQQMLADRRKEWFKAGKGDIPALVFITEDGMMLDGANLRKVMTRALKAAGLPPHFTPHCLRHTFASLLLQRGESPAYVQRQLGHASIQLTVDTYGKWLPMGNKGAVDGLDDDSAADVRAEGADAASAAGSVPPNGSKMVADQRGEEDECSQVIDFIGEPSRNRTWNLLIKSQLLCQLS